MSFTVDPFTINISWSPPFTLSGTAITGYNISVTSNGTTTNYFTSDSYYVLQLSGSISSNDTSIAVSGYNGLDGETLSLNVWQSSGMEWNSIKFSKYIYKFLYSKAVLMYIKHVQFCLYIVPSSDVPIPVCMKIMGILQLFIMINVSHAMLNVLYNYLYFFNFYISLCTCVHIYMYFTVETQPY